MVEELLEEILEYARTPVVVSLTWPEPDDVPTFGDAIDAWLEYLEVERRRKHSTVRRRRLEIPDVRRAARSDNEINEEVPERQAA